MATTRCHAAEALGEPLAAFMSWLLRINVRSLRQAPGWFFGVASAETFDVDQCGLLLNPVV